MWWNFVGRDHDEIVAAREDWMAQITDNDGPIQDTSQTYDGRFGIVDRRPPAPHPRPGPPQRQAQASTAV